MAEAKDQPEEAGHDPQVTGSRGCLVATAPAEGPGSGQAPQTKKMGEGEGREASTLVDLILLVHERLY